MRQGILSLLANGKFSNVKIITTCVVGRKRDDLVKRRDTTVKVDDPLCAAGLSTCWSRRNLQEGQGLMTSDTMRRSLPCCLVMDTLTRLGGIKRRCLRWQVFEFKLRGYS